MPHTGGAVGVAAPTPQPGMGIFAMMATLGTMPVQLPPSGPTVAQTDGKVEQGQNVLQLRKIDFKGF